MDSPNEIEEFVNAALSDRNDQKQLFEMIEYYNDQNSTSIESSKIKLNRYWILIKSYFFLIQHPSNYSYELIFELLMLYAKYNIIFFIDQKELVIYILELFTKLIQPKLPPGSNQKNTLNISASSSSNVQSGLDLKILYLMLYKTLILVLEHIKDNRKLKFETILNVIS